MLSLGSDVRFDTTADSDPQQDEGTLVRDLLTLLKRHQGSVHPLRRPESGGTETGAQGGDVPSEGKISDLTKESWERIKNPTKQLDTWVICKINI